MKIGITGATGQLGRLVIENLKTRVSHVNIIALVRSKEKGKDLGVETREFDYSKTVNLEVSLKDIDTLLLISSNEIGQRAIQHFNVIESAKKAGIKWIVYTSLLHSDTSSLSLAPEHLETEKALINSGIPYTILRNGWYNENYIGSVQSAIAHNAYLGSAGDGKISSAARIDFAEAAVAVITGVGHQNKIYELAGDEAYTLSDLAAEISRQTGKNIPYNNLPESDYARILQNAGVPEGFAKLIAGWDTAASKNDLMDTSRQLSKLIGRPTTPISKTISQVVSNK